MFVDLYAIQNVPSSNINRDDTGSPKTAFYGGVQRARVSSQAWKRAMREMFPTLLSEDGLGVRTKLAVSLIAKWIAKKRPDLEACADALARGVLESAGLKVEETTREGSDKGSLATEYLIFIGRLELEKLADLAIGWHDGGAAVDKPDRQMKKDVSEVFHGTQAIDVALFGRMLANAPDLNVDASAQVAHAISVDRVVQEYDYFTAVDDCAADDNAGASMLGTIEFNSSTLYRYATVNLDSLVSQLGDAQAAAEGLSAFVEAFARSMPTGKQNTFANRTLPNAVVVAFRESQPVNPVSAFEVPVAPREDFSISAQAISRLSRELEKVETKFNMPAAKKWCLLVDDFDMEAVGGLGEQVDMDSLLCRVRDSAMDALSGKEE